jgi:hypothetical protein
VGGTSGRVPAGGQGEVVEGNRRFDRILETVARGLEVKLRYTANMWRKVRGKYENCEGLFTDFGNKRLVELAVYAQKTAEDLIQAGVHEFLHGAGVPEKDIKNAVAAAWKSYKVRYIVAERLLAQATGLASTFEDSGLRNSHSERESDNTS